MGTRLRAVAEAIPPGSRVADIGSDHGRLPALLLAEGLVAACVATERLPGEPLCSLRGADPRLAVRFGDGLAALGADDAPEVVTLCGLGARSIVRILEKDRERLAPVRRLVLQPQSEWPRVRQWLRHRGFRLVDERLVRERGRFYLVLVADPLPSGHDDDAYRSYRGLSAEELLAAGPLLVRHRRHEAAAYWRERLARATRDATAAAGGDDSGPSEERQLARRILTVCNGPERLSE